MLADCICKDASNAELFVVQASLAPVAMQVRNRMTQAVLGVNSSVTKIEGASLDTLLDDQQVKGIIAALGIGFCVFGDGSSLDLARLRYGKIIVVFERTPEGKYVCEQVLTLFQRFFRPIVQAGHVFVAVPKVLEVQDDATFETDVMAPASRRLVLATA